MTEAQAYLEIAERSVEGGQAANDAGVHEKCCFLAYHGFESIGGAYCRHKSVSYPLGHAKKVRTFISEAHHERFGLSAATLAIELASIRNLTLYPVVAPSGTVSSPRNRFTAPQAARLLGRTKALIEQVKRML